jgi:ABC-2 type transport system permease protein
MSKYLAVARMGLATAVAYRGEYFLRSLSLVLILFVFAVLWRTVYSTVGTASIEGFEFRDMIWYLAITESIIASRPRLAGRVDAEVKSGTLAYTLSRPYSYILYHYAYAMGEAAARGVIAFGVAGAVVALMAGPPSFHLGNLGVFVPAVVLAGTIDFLLAFAVGLLAFWVEETAPFALIYDRLLMLLGGMMLPLEIFPALLRKVAGWTPLSVIIYAPARLLVGQQTTAPAPVLLAQTGWLAAAAGVCVLVFRAGVKRVNIHGG